MPCCAISYCALLCNAAPAYLVLRLNLLLRSTVLCGTCVSRAAYFAVDMYVVWRSMV